MTHELQFEITKEDIRDGRPRNIVCCPVSLAMRRQFPYASFVSTGITGVRVQLGGEMYGFRLDDAAVAFINIFDRTGRGRPQTVTARRKYGYEQNG